MKRLEWFLSSQNQGANAPRSPLSIVFLLLLAATPLYGAEPGIEFFEAKIRPVLAEHCYSCHSKKAKKIKGGLRLDTRAGWQEGGNSGSPAIVPGKPDESPLIRAVQHIRREDAMPPNQAKLPERIIADLVAWVKMGAPDPRTDPSGPPVKKDWEAVYQERLQWWSLQPLAKVQPPAKLNAQTWPLQDVDRFILASLEANGLKPAPEADRRTLGRRLSFALTGLPPDPKVVEAFARNDAPDAYASLVQSYLASPHFGERWARHWMDVVHYSDTHGYEWDVPAKNAWMYRDYLVRAFNSDLPFQQLILEQVAGDLLPARVDPVSGVNEALIAPMAFRLGERRHGDSAAAEGVTQEAITNVIDTLSKGFLGTTIACAQCHDHKLDAVSQADYYSLAGVFMSTRWTVRGVESADPNLAVLRELSEIKRSLRQALAKRWTGHLPALEEKLRTTPPAEKASAAFPQNLKDFFTRPKTSPITEAEFLKESERRVAENLANLKLLADFTREGGEGPWRWDGLGMKHGLVRDGDFAVADDGDAALTQILPAGRWSHAWSQRLAGAVRSPLFDPKLGMTFSVGFAGSRQVGQSFNIDQAFHSERMKFLNQPTLGWLTLRAGGFDTLEGGIDRADRRVYLELATKSLNNYFPPRWGYGGVKEGDINDPRSWFGVTRIYHHSASKPPQDPLTHLLPLVRGEGDAARRITALLQDAVARWSRDASTSDDARNLDEALKLGWLPNDLAGSEEIRSLVAHYREVEKKLQPERTVGSMAEWNEARDERIGIRGSYTDLGAAVPRGNIRFLGGPAPRESVASGGRLELARNLASPDNPLTARVFVNRVWLHLFGEGLVRTPDDFGRLGQKPSHPELLDYLAQRFLLEGWSVKKLITMLVTSATWKQGSQPDAAAVKVDPENRLWHHMPMRRLDAESIRDAMLFASGRLDASLFGPPIDPYRVAEDAQKRLLKGPLDGKGRRSIYTKLTLMEPPRFLALFNQPIPRLTVGKRDMTSVPDQALALLNDPLVVELAKHWSKSALGDGATTPDERMARMFSVALGRPVEAGEKDRLQGLLAKLAEARGVQASAILVSEPVWQDFAHALFNVKEFIYVR